MDLWPSQVGPWSRWCDCRRLASEGHGRHRWQGGTIRRCEPQRLLGPHTNILGQHHLLSVCAGQVFRIATTILPEVRAKCPLQHACRSLSSSHPPFPPDQDRGYVNIVKHVYLRKNKLWSKDCMSLCQGSPLKFDWGGTSQGMAWWHSTTCWTGWVACRSISAKIGKKLTLDQSAREAG